MPAPDADAGFVVAAVREPGTSADARVREAAGGVRSWPRVLRLAVEHGVVQYVRSSLIRCAVVPPGGIDLALRDAELADVATTLMLDAELERVLGVLGSRSIDTLVLKGPVLARSLYPQRFLRPYRDVDVCVHDADLDRAADALVGSGFREIAYEAEVARLAFTAAGSQGRFHRMFVDADGRALIELHSDPLQLGLPPAAEDDRWRRAIPAPELGQGAMTLGDDDQLLHLCVHAHKHGFSRLMWLKDLDLILRTKGTAIDWRLVEDAARREGVRASIWYALSLTSAILGTPLPAAAVAMAPWLPIRFLYRRVWPAERVAGLSAGMRRRAVQFHVAESWSGMLPTLVLMGRRRDRARLLLRSLRHRSTGTQPSSHERRTG